MSNLLPCPFCGNSEITSRMVLVAFEGPEWGVRCKCGISIQMAMRSLKDEGVAQARAEAAWNKREMGTQKVLVELFKERVRQIALEHFTPSHDLHHSPGCLARAGAAYALLDVKAPAITYHGDGMKADFQLELKLLSSFLWPWDDDSFKPKDPRRNLVRAAALIIAEIERMDRAAQLKAAALGDVDA